MRNTVRVNAVHMAIGLQGQDTPHDAGIEFLRRTGGFISSQSVLRHRSDLAMQLQKCAQQFIRMDNVAATFAMRANDPTATVACNGTSITP